MEMNDLDSRILRFLLTIYKYLPDKAKPAFIQSTAKTYNLNELLLQVKLNEEIERNGGGSSTAFPYCVFMDLREKSDEVIAERNKLVVLRQLVLDGEDFQFLLGLVDEPVIMYCKFCKQFGFHRSVYMSHNKTNSEGLICLSTLYVPEESCYIIPNIP